MEPSPGRARSRVALVLAAAALAGAFSSGVLRADQTVTIVSFSFNPPTVTVAPGETVTWVWAAGGHSTTSNATSGPEFWDSGVVFTVGATFAHTFTTPGTYPYYCSVHSSPTGTTMNGVVIVVPPTATPTAIPTSTPTPSPIPTATPLPSGTAVPALGGGAFAALAFALAAAALYRILGRR